MTRTCFAAAFTALALPLAVACTATENTPAATEAASASPEASMTTSAPAPEGTRTPGAGEPVPATPAADEAANDSCGASKVRARWSNALPTEDVKADIAKRVGERRIRYYTDGDPITMDYSEERLNVVLGKDGRIAEFRCG
jgi:hypothetical protein